MTAQARPAFAMRPFLPADTALLAEIFRASVEELTEDAYDASQREAWIASVDDEDAFGARLAGALTLVATRAGSPVGFASLKEAREIDLLYVHPAAAGQGVGSMLVDALEKLAAARGATSLAADVSDSAHDFFRHRGFVDQRRNAVRRADQWLSNTTMEKQLPAKETVQ
ncbi:MAG: N-acetyltransferase family protein [Pseudorhodoplanes sp.]